MSRLQPRTPITAAPLPGEAQQHKQPASIPLRIFATCLTSVVVAVHYTNYGPLIPTLIGDLHITSGEAGLLSTFLFLGRFIYPAGHRCDIAAALTQFFLDSRVPLRRWSWFRRSLRGRGRSSLQSG